MSVNYVRFHTGAVKPIECFKTGWNIIKDQYWLFLGITFVGMLIGSLVPFNILMGPMMCGIYMCILYKHRVGSPPFDMLFKGFDHFAQSLIATLIMVVPMFAIMVPFYIIFMVYSIALSEQHAEPGALFFIVLLLMFVVFFVLYILMGLFFTLAYPLIADRGLSGVEALKTAGKAAWRNLGGMLGLLLLEMLLFMVGLACCYVGIIFILPISMAASTVAYLQVFGDEAQTPAQQGRLEGITPSGM